MLRRPVDVYEKLDGLNVGFAFEGPGQLRILSRVHGAFSPQRLGGDLWRLSSWAGRHQARLWALLGTRRAAFGEWLEPRLGIAYPQLPELLVFFDLVDRAAGRPVAHGRAALRGHGFTVNPRLARRRFAGVEALAQLRAPLAFGARQREGFLLEAGSARYKLVLPGYQKPHAASLGGEVNTLARHATARTLRCPV